MQKSVDDYFNQLNQWQSELKLLRRLLTDCGLNETIKWGTPCYTYNNKNIVLLATFKEYCALSFIKGVLLQDAAQLLVAPGAHSQSVKYFRFMSTKEINGLKDSIRQYIYEAIEIEKAGLQVNKTQSTNFELPEELVEVFNREVAFKNAFNKLTTGRQRAYVLYFSEAKQSTTRLKRIEKYMPRILKGKGINDCICGLSKRPPTCDGSHKQIKNFNPLDL